MKPPNNFAVFILSNGRPDRVLTHSLLRRRGYSGKIYVVIDDEDEHGDAYRERYGDEVLTFSKRAIDCDTGDNLDDMRTPLFARNANWALARAVGIRWFMQMDDDYRSLSFRGEFDGQEALATSKNAMVSDLDRVLALMLEYYKSIPALSIAFAQGGDFIGGTGNTFNKRKAMNSFLCDVERPFEFVGRINDDVNTYTSLSRRGALFLTIPSVMLTQGQTQAHAGGMTELYKDKGTYTKSFYSVMITPSAVRVDALRCGASDYRRVHHKINWTACAAQIIRDVYKLRATDGQNAA